MKFKKFTLYALFFIIIYLSFHAIIWHKETSKIFGRKDGKYVGDIARVSYQIQALFPRKLEYTLEKKHLNKVNYKYKQIDIITIGDSFSQGVTGGRNPYYQDYIATLYNQNILNISRTAHGQFQFFEPIITLYNNGWLQKHKVKYIIIESVERFVIPRFAKQFDLNRSDFSKNELPKYILSARTHNSYIPQLKLINTANYKYIYYNYIYNNPPKVETDVIKLQLDKNLFSTKTFQNQLLIHNEDIISLNYYTQKSVELINNSFNSLAKKLKPLGIQLIFLVGPDKYDITYPYIKDNPFTSNRFFALMRPLKKEYIFIDTKKVLRNLLKNNIKDVYYSDDTHWSYKASQAITKSIQFQKLFGENK